MGENRSSDKDIPLVTLELEMPSRPSDGLVGELLMRLRGEGSPLAREAARMIEVLHAEAEQAYDVGESEGRESAVQRIDVLTGGDGEYRFCTNGDPERHTPDADAMQARIVARFAEPFVAGLLAMRAMLADFVEQGGDPVTASSLRLNWSPSWGPDPAAKESRRG